MIKGGKGGGNTLTGLNFEREKDILELFSKTKGYSVKGHSILYNGKEVARSYRKNSLYKFLESQGVKYSEILSKKLGNGIIQFFLWFSIYYTYFNFAFYYTGNQKKSIFKISCYYISIFIFQFISFLAWSKWHCRQ